MFSNGVSADLFEKKRDSEAILVFCKAENGKSAVESENE